MEPAGPEMHPTESNRTEQKVPDSMAALAVRARHQANDAHAEGSVGSNVG